MSVLGFNLSGFVLSNGPSLGFSDRINVALVKAGKFAGS